MNNNVLKYSLFFILFLSVIFIIGVQTSLASSLPFELRGRFLIQVDNKGQAWYVDANNNLRHDVSNNNSFLDLVKSVGLGISNSNLQKIPIAINNNLITIDSDDDGLDDELEKTIGTNHFNSDSDGDGYDDKTEISHYFNPTGKGKTPIDTKLTSDLAGKLLLQVEGQGQIWYINPTDNLRYYIKNHSDLLKIIALTGQGISSDNLKLIIDNKEIKAGAEKNIKIDVSKKQRLYYYLGDTEIGSFPVSSGKYSTPTPKGNFKIINKHPKAWSYFGLWMPYWMGLGTGSFGLHELPIWPSGYREGESHLGIPVSHGCIRLGVGSAKFLYNWAEVGTPVYIY